MISETQAFKDVFTINPLFNIFSTITNKGLSYINHIENNKKILLFVREKANNEKGNTMGYVFIGEGVFKDTKGSKPMSVKWELSEPMPNYLWKESAKNVNWLINLDFITMTLLEKIEFLEQLLN
ncbi:DUF3427 domain-containing protein [Flavobacterium sp. GT2N3]|uniref:DUF3427 domain-containing protein n=1 Tax=unclassified Flavobacterium TaxID=196869 RepID=UPI003AAD5E98